MASKERVDTKAVMAKAARGKSAREESVRSLEDIGDMVDRWPTLNCLLTYRGTKEEPIDTCSITLFTNEFGLRGKLNDRDNDMSVWVESRTLEGVMQSFEDRLTGPESAWTANSSGTTRKRGRRGR